MNNKHYLNSTQFSSREFMAFSFAMMVILSIAVTRPLVPNDFYPYLRIGDEIIRTHRIPTTEFMTYTQFGDPAFYPHWLFSLISLGIYQTGGAALTAFVSMLLIGGFYLFLWLSLRNEGASVLTSMILMLYVAFIHGKFFSIRPQLFTYPLLGMVIFSMTRWMKDDNRYLWTLPIISFLWVNFHGSFIVIFLILIPALIFGPGDKKRLMIFSSIALITTFLNYYSFNIWLYVFRMVNSAVIQLHISEWQPPVNQGWQMHLFFGGILIIPVLYSIYKPKIKTVYWVWFLGFGWMALNSIRYLIWFLPFLALIYSEILDPLEKRVGLRKDWFQNHTLNILIGILLLVFPSTLLPGVRHRWLNNPTPVHDHITPVEATEWMKKNPQLPENMWSDFNYACYFSYKLPQKRIFMSNKIQDINDEVLSDYIQITNAVYNWPLLLDKYNVNTLVLDFGNQSDLINAVQSSFKWEEDYRDQKTVIFKRKNYRSSD